jgi:hypothetical protein
MGKIIPKRHKVIIDKGQGDSDMREIEIEVIKKRRESSAHKLEDVKSEMFFRRDGIRLISLTKEKLFQKRRMG